MLLSVCQDEKNNPVGDIHKPPHYLLTLSALS